MTPLRSAAVTTAVVLAAFLGLVLTQVTGPAEWLDPPLPVRGLSGNLNRRCLEIGYVVGNYPLDSMGLIRQDLSPRELLGFGIIHERHIEGGLHSTGPAPFATRYGFRISLWTMHAFLAVLLIIVMTRLGRQVALARRPPRGVCPTCGYDLRATPEPGSTLLDRCPECGCSVTPGGAAPDRHCALQVH